MEARLPPGAAPLHPERLTLLISALHMHQAAGLFASSMGTSCGAKVTVQAADVESAVEAGLRAWNQAAEHAGLLQWPLVRCEAVRDVRKPGTR
jgi:hypothetical protein